MWLWSTQSDHADYARLGLVDEDDASDPEVLYAIPAAQLPKSRRAGALGVLLFVATIEGPTAVMGGTFGEAWTSIHPLTYMLGLGILFSWVAGRAAYLSTAREQLESPLERLDLDLLDREPLRVFGRMALRNAFIWVAGTSIAALAFVNPELRISESLLVVGPLSLAALAIGVAAMLLPMRGLHDRIVDAKSQELARVEAAIRGEAGALSGSRIEARDPPPSLADLIAYRGLVQAAPEWPLDASSFRRLGLYLLLPIGSWVGGALVERGVGVLLD